ncbi:carbohydrate ABC transporter permease [Paenibacillus mucilaginosus]|uniref:Binding-protein-dependent transport systems inner membrane component n=3 Tax=Paenibacillus mucilaginosus TaxID=61624 RepID=H6N986_9BACL|nr:carbohydrate ABC transporter permease [Paenibacillus mucilaginosus]AEI39587.1 binding-protein-dependent transport systems inner membrane component [Paenibacillus mucilaginosus KNP414]AFC27832.1 binding-protein-dependent transport systems inner membrane component [Paenibacillus mucilaginosus 3016]AFH59985.1 ABC transporter permease [Paenibacillus mucilaginosus K02]MCG7214604.1 carbohydrate ABC transporter permease [Paenibacillus mucilaginosus]WDM28534.1 carbohydrate ABC transporter permease 
MVKSLEDRLMNAAVLLILGLAGAAAVFPLMYVVSVSVTPFSEVLKNGGFILIPRSFTFSAYTQLFTESAIPRAFAVTVFITVVGTLINLVLTALMAYPLSRKGLPGRSFFLLMVVFTMLFSGGIIPTYLIVKALGLVDSVWSMILPNAVWSFNVLIMKSFYESLPEELFESARMDGAREFRILLQLVVPLSIPSMLTVGLFYMVGHWNEFFQAVMYVTDRSLFPLQVIIRELLMMTQQPLENAENMLPTETMQMASVVTASLPIILVYPFIQKHFTKGMLLGSVKG